MSLELQNKYGFDILIDFNADYFSSLKPGSAPPTPPLVTGEAFASMMRRQAKVKMV
ncbi:MAG TPA: hypothetical protein VH640_29060 [Bryobacteraceae bacterium]